MEDNARTNTFTPTFSGIHRLFRLPFASVYVPVIPCVYDGTLSVLELIARIHHNLNQVIEACNQNHTDIMNLKIYVDSVIEDLTAYIDAQDAATLGASKEYADGLVAALREWTVEQLAGKQDLLTFDSTPTDGSSNPVTSDGIFDALAGKQDTLTFDNAPTDGSSNPVTSDGIYDALAGKQDTLTFDTTPTDGSSNPVTSNGIYDAIAAGLTSAEGYADNKFQIKNAYYTATRTIDTASTTITCDLDMSSIMAFASQNRMIVIKMQTVNTTTIQRSYNNEWFYFAGIKYDSNGIATDAVFMSFTGTLECSALSAWTFIPA